MVERGVRGIRAIMRERAGGLARIASLGWNGALAGLALTLAAATAINPRDEEVIPYLGLVAASLLWGAACGAYRRYRTRRRRVQVSLTKNQDGKATLTFDFEGGNSNVLTLAPELIRSLRRRKNSLWLSFGDGTLLQLTMPDADAEAVANALGETRSFRLGRDAPPRGSFALVVGFLVGLATFTGLGIAGVGIDVIAPLTTFSTALSALIAGSLVRAKEVVAGLDGLRIGRKYFEASEIKELSVQGAWVFVATKAGKTHRFLVRLESELAELLNELMRDNAAADAAEAESFGRHEGESFREWITRVRKSFAGSDFRQGVVPKEKALAALKTPNLPPRVRVAVAAALNESHANEVEDVLVALADERTQRAARAAMGDEFDDPYLQAL